jgi:hypothetical protein
MPSLNWNIFEGLPGSSQENFEMLCRGLIRRHYSQFGRFAARANQPGVEFHLELRKPCSLGDSSNWFGWQCRWYDLPSGRALGNTRRDKIVKAICTTERELPDLTDWILWTRHPLTENDQKWYYGLTTKMKLQLWTAAEVEEHLSGPAEILRGTYFGELVLTPDVLSDLHTRAVAPIQRRWRPEVHQTVRAERALRRMLGETNKWNQLLGLASQLEVDATLVEVDLREMDGSSATATSKLASVARSEANRLTDVHTALERGDLDLLRQLLKSSAGEPYQKLVGLPRKLRATRRRAALSVTNALASVRACRKLLAKMDVLLGKSLIAIVAEAGCGKTQLAAQLTATSTVRPAGILLHGRDLQGGHNLHDLAANVVIQGKPVQSMDALVAAVDAAGQRAHRRLPIVIDGLNEAEDPRDWKALIASLEAILGSYPYVLFVCTLRRDFVDESVPTDIDRLGIPDFGHDTYEAIGRYFEYYQIDSTDAELPIGLLKRPLTLSLFCQVTNPKRERKVGIEAMPTSFSSLFDRYLKQAAERIAELAPRTQRYFEQDVRRALDLIGAALWDQNVRGLNEGDLRRNLGDEVRPWNESIIRALEQEGIILRLLDQTSGEMRVAAVYDALAGHLMADAILARCGRSGFENWVADPSIMTRFSGLPADRHPIAMDMFRALVGLFPRRLHRQQLWPSLNEPLRTVALLEAANLESAHIDSQTVERLTALTRNPVDRTRRDLFHRLWETRGALDHPLNAEFLDAVLRPMTMVARDLRWTEWIRRNSGELVTDLEWLEQYWSDRTIRTPSDKLRARWVMWTQTSTVRRLRDQATRTLYWFGRGDPGNLFGLTLDSLEINDPYVPERMLAASYGVAMALHSDPSALGFKEQILPTFARDLYRSMFATNAPHSTTHVLMRDFARHIIQIALLHNPTAIGSRQRKRTVPPFRDGGIRKWGRHRGFGHNIEDSYAGPLRMDFSNYTLGRLVPNRSNYDFTDAEYMRTVENLYWRLDQMGYTPDSFEEVDKEISSRGRYSRHEENESRVDRYGKKYSWISFYELYGFRQDKGLLKDRFNVRERPSSVDIDPSFPDEPHNIEIITNDWLGDRSTDLEFWIENGERPQIEPYLMLNELNGLEGPWVLLDGFFTQVDKQHNRAIFGFLRGMLVSQLLAVEVQRLLTKQRLGGLRLPDNPEDYYTFAGEIPWCETFSKNGFTELELVAGHKKKRIPELRFYRKTKRLDDGETKALFAKLGPALEKRDRDMAVREILESEGVTLREIKRWSAHGETIYKKLPVLLPVRENNWESYHSGANPGQHAIIPAREISETFGLSIRLPQWDMHDFKGETASISVKWGDLWRTGHNLCYLHKNILDQFLKKKQMRLIWAFWGEREIRMGSEIPECRKKEIKHTHKRFQRIYSYHNGRLIVGEAR